MRVIAAYLLLSQSGNKPSADDVTSFLKGLEIEVDDAAVKGFFEKLGEQDITELITAGQKKLVSGGGSGGPAASNGGAAGEEEKEEEKEEEEEEEEEVAMGNLMGGDDDGW